MYNLASLVDVSTALGSTRPAFITANGTVTYRELSDQISVARSHLLSLGVRKGDRVALSLTDAPDFAVAFYAALGIGAIAVPLDPCLTEQRASDHLRDSGAKILVGHGREERWLQNSSVDLIGVERLRRPSAFEPMSPVMIDETAAIIYTPNLDGASRAVELSHANLVFGVHELSDPAIFGPIQTDVVATVLPLFVPAGLAMLNLTLHAGAALLPVESFEGRRLVDVIAAGQISVLSAAPTQITSLMAASTTLNVPMRLRRLATTGALPLAVRQWARTRLRTHVLAGYGPTEASSAVTFNRADTPIRPGSVGRPLPRVEIKIVDPLDEGVAMPAGAAGRIMVRGPNVMKGYWNNRLATEGKIDEGWLTTDDIGRIDADGYLYVAERRKEDTTGGGFASSGRLRS